MFTGIIETLGVITNLVKEQENLHLTIKSSIAHELKVDQSVAHNGVCLTVVGIEGDTYKVTAIKETLNKTTVGDLQLNTAVNLERGMKLGDRLDGHIVQGHVDETGICTAIENQNGSTVFTISYHSEKNNITIEKGSITINGVSLTVINSTDSSFSVAIIPYTYNNTSFKTLALNDKVNLEFDVIWKYVSRLTKK
jgi:riboflavin synthase